MEATGNNRDKHEQTTLDSAPPTWAEINALLNQPEHESDLEQQATSSAPHSVGAASTTTSVNFEQDSIESDVVQEQRIRNLERQMAKQREQLEALQRRLQDSPPCIAQDCNREGSAQERIYYLEETIAKQRALISSILRQLDERHPHPSTARRTTEAAQAATTTRRMQQATTATSRQERLQNDCERQFGCNTMKEEQREQLVVFVLLVGSFFLIAGFWFS